MEQSNDFLSYRFSYAWIEAYASESMEIIFYLCDRWSSSSCKLGCAFQTPERTSLAPLTFIMLQLIKHAVKLVFLAQTKLDENNIQSVHLLFCVWYNRSILIQAWQLMIDQLEISPCFAIHPHPSAPYGIRQGYQINYLHLTSLQSSADICPIELNKLISTNEYFDAQP